MKSSSGTASTGHSERRIANKPSFRYVISLPPVFPRSHPINTDKVAQIAAQAAADKKAEDIVIIDLRGISTFTDFFVVCSGTSEPQLKAISSEIEEQLRRDHDVRAVAVEGYPMSQWVVMDYGGVVIHIFHVKKRDFYNLEDLWGDAPRVSLDG